MVSSRVWNTPRVYLFIEHIGYLSWVKPSLEVGWVRSLLGLVLTMVPLPNPPQLATVECFNQFPRLCSWLRSSRMIYSLLFNFLNKRGEMYALKVDWKHISSSFKEISCRGAEFSKATFVSFNFFFNSIKNVRIMRSSLFKLFPNSSIGRFRNHLSPYAAPCLFRHCKV